MKTITKIGPVKLQRKAKKRVAAYCRVSADTDRLNHSLSTQVSVYSSLIQSNPEWEFAGIYSDHALSGTRISKRKGLLSLLEDCDAGLVDIVLVKSISRLARNTVDLLHTVRHLKDIGVEVRFEKENINTSSLEGEFMLSILASTAQMETESISENIKWGIRKRMESGLPYGHPSIYGYVWEGDTLVINEGEAWVVRRIFHAFVNGWSVSKITQSLNDDEIPSKFGGEWCETAVGYILENVVYAGDYLQQKKYVSNPLTGIIKKNNGELPQYLIEGSHEAIVIRGVFDKAQEILAYKRSLGWRANESLKLNCFSGKIKCPTCGSSYGKGSTRKNNRTHTTCTSEEISYWCCMQIKKGCGCANRAVIRDDVLRSKAAEALELESFDEDVFDAQIERIVVHDDFHLEFIFKDGHIKTSTWENNGRKESWTPERREAFKKMLRDKRIKGEGNKYAFTARLRCESCGSLFWHKFSKSKAGNVASKWWHQGDVYIGCAPYSLNDEKLKSICCTVLGMTEFDDEVFRQKVDHIDVADDMRLIFHLTDCTISCAGYKPTGRGRVLHLSKLEEREEA